LLRTAFFLFLACTLMHFVHNAEFLADYPNMPKGLSRGSVYLAWLVLASVGAAGYFLRVRGHRWTGTATLGAATLMAFDSLGHYWLAPFSAHTAAMNATILADVASAALLLFATLSALPANATTLRRAGPHTT
jgi:hypothetical protein